MDRNVVTGARGASTAVPRATGLILELQWAWYSRSEKNWSTEI